MYLRRLPLNDGNRTPRTGLMRLIRRILQVSHRPQATKLLPRLLLLHRLLLSSDGHVPGRDISLISVTQTMIDEIQVVLLVACLLATSGNRPCTHVGSSALSGDFALPLWIEPGCDA